jgi:sugar lactone lactonase YvrE
VAVDRAGNIYVTEKGSDQVKTILKSADIVAAAQTATFRSPTGLGVAANGTLVVADSNYSVQEIEYGAPQITAVGPVSISNKGGDVVTIRGNNFAPGSIAVVAGIVVSPSFQDTQTIVFTAPALPSGQQTVTIQNRGGLAQASILVSAIPLSALAPGYITTVAGGSQYAGEGQIAISAILTSPRDVALDAAGNLYIVDDVEGKVRKVDRITGIMTTVAGTGALSGNSTGPAVATALLAPSGIAMDSANNLFILSGGYISKVDLTSGLLTTVAGNGTYPFVPDVGPAASVGFTPGGRIAIDARNNIFVTDGFSASVRKLEAATGLVTLFAGTGVAGFGGDSGPATQAQLNGPSGIAVSSDGSVYFSESINNRVRKVSSQTGIISTVAGNGLSGPFGLKLDSNGNLLLAETYGNRIRKVNPQTGSIATVAGTGSANFTGDGGSAVSAALNSPSDMFADAAGNVWIADQGNKRVRKIDARTGFISTVAGAGQRDLGDGKTATAASVSLPFGVRVDAAGNIYIADTSNNRVRKVDAAGVIRTVAGGGNGTNLDNVPATSVALPQPTGLALDGANNLFVLTNGSQLFRIDAAGIIHRVSGSPAASGYSGDNGPAINAKLHTVNSKIALDSSGNLYIADNYNNRVRKIDAGTQTITTVAGNGQPGSSGEGVPATSAAVSTSSIVVDAAGNLYIGGNNRVREVSAQTGIITTIAGNGQVGSSGDDGPATLAALDEPLGLVLDSAGNLYILTNPVFSTAADRAPRIRRMNLATGVITTVAGTTGSALGDNGPARTATFFPFDIAVDSSDNLFIADGGNNRIRVIRAPIP